jgi:FtsP/CotA-like multicopper oxidase with cupredoxin domain
LRYSLVPTLALTLIASASRSPNAASSTLVPNPNTSPAGALDNGVLTLDLEAVRAKWHRGSGMTPGKEIDAFAEVDKSPTMPGPLVRVPAGTELRVRVRNRLNHQITFFVPNPASGEDSVVIAAGASGQLSARLTGPGNFIYRATDTTAIAASLSMDGALGGAIVVDTAGRPRPRDRVFMIMMFFDSTLTANSQVRADIGAPGRLLFTLNGLAWPNTERMSATVGDTLHWRVINGSGDVHPMHLHGAYYRVDDFTRLLMAGTGPATPSGEVVTQRLGNYTAMNMTWVPQAPGNWLFHCHFALHVAAARDQAAQSAEHENHALSDMTGLVLGVVVSPRQGDKVIAEAPPERRIRLVAVRDSAFPDSAPQMRFLIEENGRRVGDRKSISPPLYLTRGQPVAITVVNRLTEPTSVHWHGIELPSYYDGVAGWSGIGDHLAPMIAPGDSFQARFAPPRAGTFMYHSHADDVVQQTAGLVGALIVQDGPSSARPDDYTIFLKGGREAFIKRQALLEINGVSNPDTIMLRAGRPARLRIMSLALASPNATVTLTTRPDSLGTLSSADTMLVRWEPIAKDGADLAASARAPRLARQIVGMGETYDYMYTPVRPGQLRIEVRTAGQKGVLLARVPVRVE